MTEPAMPRPAADRRRVERRTNSRLADLSLPEFRKILVTTTLFVIVLVLFLWMVRTVIIATILGIVVAVYVRPIYELLRPRIGTVAAAVTTLAAVIVPILALLVYSYGEVADVAAYVDRNSAEIAARIDEKLRQLPFLADVNATASIQRWVVRASNYGTTIPQTIRDTIASFSVAAAVFIFTTFYILVDTDTIVAYVRSKIPPRYTELVASLEQNVRGVLYGAIYSTVLTQTIKSANILVLNLIFGVPLAAVLAILSFIIGFFPIVGSWSVYVPVAAWLLVFRDAPGQALIMVLIGFLVNTVYISTYLRPKIAAERSRVLNFYWMFLGLVTGVYTFGLVGILLGPILIGLLKAIVDTVTATGTWQLIESEGDVPPDKTSLVG